MINRLTTHEYASTDIFIYENLSPISAHLCSSSSSSESYIICPYGNGFNVDDDIFILYIDSGKICLLSLYFILVFSR